MPRSIPTVTSTSSFQHSRLALSSQSTAPEEMTISPLTGRPKQQKMQPKHLSSAVRMPRQVSMRRNIPSQQ